ncbi:MAG TPA: 50S ribosomal protein L15 [Candidatus Saccharimonadales bacterium]|jgi:large subunit ribosomal protein L15
MRIHELDLPANKKSNRKGRGISAGQGKTAGRGTKGQNSRTGGGVRPGFEGGQNPLSARLPKLAGFTSRRTQKQTITTGQLARIKAKTIDNVVLAEAGFIERLDMPAKVVFSGQLDSAKTVKLQAASPQAAEAITKAGGTFVESAAPKQYRAGKGKDKPTKKS